MSATRRFLVLHGLQNHRPPAHWHWWLVDQLRSRGEQVLYPQLPNADTPQLDEWLELLAAEWAQMGDGERIVIAHSMGCVLWYEASAAAVLDRAADRVLLVSPPGPAFIRGPLVATFSSGSWKADPLRASSRSTIRLVGSDADPYCVEGPAAAVYGEPLALDAETITGAGHITIDDGYGHWPDALRWCLDPSTRFSGTVTPDP